MSDAERISQLISALRDENDALRARIEALEAKLSAAKD